MPIYKNKFFIALVIFVILVAGFLLFGKNLIYPPRASEKVTVYNILSRSYNDLEGVKLPSRTVRWKSLPVAVYNKANFQNLENILEEWNQAMGQKVFEIGGSDSPIVIEADLNQAPGEFFRHSFRHSLLTKVEIVNHPDWMTSVRIKHQLGHALGFFGHTTENPPSIMDSDDNLLNNASFTPLVISTLKELYQLPPGTRSWDFSPNNFSKQLLLRKEIQRYNIDSRPTIAFTDELKNIYPEKHFAFLPIHSGVLRWRNLPVAVYNKANFQNLENILEEWNQAMGQKVFEIGGSDSPIVIEVSEKVLPIESNEWQVKPGTQFLLDKFRVVFHPTVISAGRIKHQLGHALGFFGHTTNDPPDIMDRDYGRLKNASISPSVIAILKELYRLPPGTDFITVKGLRFAELAKLRQAVKKYNIEPRGKTSIGTVHWRSLPVTIYNQANISGLQSILDEWNQAMGQEVFKIGGADSPIIIEADTAPNPLPFPTYEAKTENYLLTLFKIKVNPQNPNLHYLKHQLGHVLGFFGHTTDDDPNGIMNEDHRRTDTVISSFVVSVLKELYYLPPGTYL